MKLKSLRTVAMVLTALLIAAASGACGDNRVVAIGGGPPGADALDASFTTSDAADADAAPEAGPEQDVPDPQGLQREIVLLHDTTKPTQVTVTEQLLIRAKVIDYALAGPAPDALVGFKIVDGGGDAQLSTGYAFTDGNGNVSVLFKAQFQADVTYRIEVSTEGAEPVFLEIYVVEEPTGDIRVKLQYEGPIAVKNVHVRLFPGGYTCGQFNPANVPEPALGEKTLLGLGSDVLFEKLPDAQKFTVVATAQSPTGSLAAAGCADGVIVVPEQENTVTLTMYLLILNPAGLYDAVNVFDFTDAIPGEVGALIDEIVTLFTDPGKFFIDQIKKLVAGYIGQWVTDLAFGLFEDALGDIITDWMLNKSPDWMQDIFIVGNDLIQIVHHLEMRAQLIISKLSNDYYVQGVLNWNGIALYWKLGCAKEGEPDYDPDCGQFVFTMEQFGNTQFPMDIIQGKFTGLIHDFDRLDIDNHIIKINYGKLIIFVLNEMLLKTITGEDNLSDALIALVNCHQIGQSFEDSILSGIGVTADGVEEFCQNAITFIADPVEILLGNLALDSQLRLTGKATLIDSQPNDLVVDEIVDGEYLGHVEVDGQEGPQFYGVWHATRK